MSQRSSLVRPRTGRWNVSQFALVAAAAASLAVATAVERTVRPAAVPPDLATRAARAEKQMLVAERHVRDAKQAAGIVADTDVGADPSGLLGDELTPLVTTLGSLEAKRLATDPSWARELTIRLHRAGVRRGDLIAASFSGSFPGLNLAVIVAGEALGARVVAVSSVTASTWGANQPGFTWPEIEARLVRDGLVRPASAVVTLGGAGDAARDLTPDARALASGIQERAAHALNAVPLVPPTPMAAVEARLALYDRLAEGCRLAIYINVGGGEASLGESGAVLRLRSGFIPGRPFDLAPDRGVMARMAERGVPVLTLLNVRDLAVRWGIGRSDPAQPGGGGID